MASKQWNLGKKEAMASTMQVNYVVTHSKLLQDSVYIKKAGRNTVMQRLFVPTSRNKRLMKKQPLVQVEPCVSVKQHLFLVPAKLTANKRGHDVFPVRTIRFSNHVKPNL